MFADACGLYTNMAKTQYFPIQREGINLEFVSSAGRYISSFPCSYLGLPLKIKKPSRTLIQPLVQKIGKRLPGWMRSFLTYLGRELLIKLVLSSIPTYFLTVFKLPKFRRSFLWRGKGPEQVKGGHCLVN
jgi:hypothetical protein